jgi:lipopolysaccharide biosynthesis regulator YciM
MQFIIEELRKRPSVRGLERLVEYNMQNTEGPARENMQILSDLVKKLSTLKSSYKCQACGFEAKAMHWHCPSCKRWNSVKPLQDIVES